MDMSCIDRAGFSHSSFQSSCSSYVREIVMLGFSSLVYLLGLHSCTLRQAFSFWPILSLLGNELSFTL